MSLREAGRDVAMGGNIGVPILDLPPPSADRASMSSNARRSRSISRRRSADGRRADQSDARPSRPARDDGELRRDQGAAGRQRRRRAGRRRRRLLPRHRRAAAPRRAGGSCRSRPRRRRSPTSGSRIASSSRAARPSAIDLAQAPALRGAHNGQNAAFAFAAARALGAERRRRSRAAMASFPGLAHRMEQVGRLGRVLFVNDSKATNADAAEKALLTLQRHLLDPRRQAQGGRHRAAAAALSARRQGLSDRRGERRLRAHARRRGRVRTLRDARERGRRRGARRAGERRRRAGRAAVAGLRVLRPVRQFRSARRSLPRAGRRAHRAPRLTTDRRSGT